ncbi:rhodanese-like domain-containing protein [Propioniciclava soli]|uniref:rhodanese-like domain-containing protein n=1 Tax=Propioniciclava soli TaxID=2775081 RepID=UPI001E3D9926|nr:rhodanese-like domain-containing protein [Propioniciclava soli]
MTQQIPLTDFITRHAEGAVVVDVREADEYAQGHVPGAVFAPMSDITSHLADLPRGREVYVICAAGRRSLAMAELMEANGILAISVDEGTQGWVAAGQPVVTESDPR